MNRATMVKMSGTLDEHAEAWFGAADRLDALAEPTSATQSDRRKRSALRESLPKMGALLRRQVEGERSKTAPRLAAAVEACEMAELAVRAAMEDLGRFRDREATATLRLVLDAIEGQKSEAEELRQSLLAEADAAEVVSRDLIALSKRLNSDQAALSTTAVPIRYHAMDARRIAESVAGEARDLRARAGF